MRNYCFDGEKLSPFALTKGLNIGFETKWMINVYCLILSLFEIRVKLKYGDFKLTSILPHYYRIIMNDISKNKLFSIVKPNLYLTRSIRK